MASVTVWFWIGLLATVALLAATLVAGRRRRRRRHIALALCAVASLAATVVLAERMARARTFPPAEMRIHLWFAKSAAALVLPVVATGIGLVRSPRLRRWHRLAVGVFLLAVLAATGTGVWVFSLSTPRPGGG